jgi:hypothetical protein
MEAREPGSGNAGKDDRSAYILLATTPDAHFDHLEGPEGAVLELPAWSAAVIRVR